MPGSPATSPNFHAPRYSDADACTFSADVNPIVDAFDSQAAKRGAIVNADIAAAAAIAESKLALASDAAATVASRRTLGAGATQAMPGNAIGFGTTLPSAPHDGQLFVFDPGGSDGTRWMLRYNAASASPYKWEFVGGTPLCAMIRSVDSRTFLSGVWADTPVTGPTLTIPASLTGGDFDVQVDATFQMSSPSPAQIYVGMAIDAADPYVIAIGWAPQAQVAGSISKRLRVPGNAGGAVLRLRYGMGIPVDIYGVPASTSFWDRALTVWPVRVG